MTLAYVAVGANLGDAQATVRWAVQALADVVQTRLRACSSLYRSAPVDAGGPDFINAVVAVDTDLTAPALLAALQDLEQQSGRVRTHRNAPRTLDLDLLMFGQARMDSASLQLPHPRMYQRAFVLLPLAELDAQLVSSADLDAVSQQVISRI
jgi:2-amino-4-hydroxy-6-hydroxymethyldihydropteridine diphosphokinase